MNIKKKKLELKNLLTNGARIIIIQSLEQTIKLKTWPEFIMVHG